MGRQTSRILSLLMTAVILTFSVCGDVYAAENDTFVVDTASADSLTDATDGTGSTDDTEITDDIADTNDTENADDIDNTENTEDADETESTDNAGFSNETETGADLSSDDDTDDNDAEYSAGDEDENAGRDVKSQGGISLFASVLSSSSVPSYSYSYTYTTLNSVTLSPSSVTVSDVLEKASTLISSMEGDYTSVAKDDNGAMSLGKLQWHGANALLLLRLIISEDNASAYSILGSTLYKEIISSSTSWSTRIATSSEATVIAKLLGSDAGIKIQDKLLNSYISGYINNATAYGIRNAAAILIYADLENQRGYTGSKTTVSGAYSLAGSYSKITANEMLMASICCYSTTSSSLYTSFVSRRLSVYGYVISLGWTYCNSGDYLIAYSYASAQSDGAKWLQYALNTVDNAGLAVDGSYGSLTTTAVTSFQNSRGLDVDGKAGVNTITALIKELYAYILENGTSAASTLAISSYTYPSTLYKGDSFSITGTIKSNYKITKVSVTVTNSSGTTKLSASATPNATSYSLAKLASKLSFSSLAKGTYTYKVTATDASSTSKTLVNKSFSVLAASTLAISSYNYPSSIKKGASYSLKGTIKSNYKITKVTISVINSSGTTKLSASATPNATSYSLAKLDAKIKFGTLSVGTYTYKVTAKDASATSKTLVKKTFKVTTSSTLKISSYNYPSSIKKGKSYSIKGTVKSNYKITKVTVSIVDSNGKTKLSASAKPNAKSYSINKLDAKIKFGTLAVGTYTYKITATDTQQSKTLVKKTFKVTTDSTLKISSYNYPSSIKKGKSYSIKGTVKSNYKITKVTVSVVNSSGKTKLSASAKPNAKSYNINKLDAKIKFGTLAKGTYTYKITATDTQQTKTLVKKTFKVT